MGGGGDSEQIHYEFELTMDIWLSVAIFFRQTILSSEF